MRKPVKIIDLFAGPGGLGEGFSSCRANDKQAFKIAISIEKEKSAHRTLLLRALFRQYEHENVPEEYYAFLRGELGKNPEDELYKIPKLAKQLEEARKEAQQLTLGEDNREIYQKIRQAIGTDECILIGGPPCQAYSLVGRSRNYGAKDKIYSATEDHRNFLYLEYLKIIAKFQPMVFVMENVKGMLSAKVDGKSIFESIRNDLQDPNKHSKVKPERGSAHHKYKIYSFVEKAGAIDSVGDEPLNPHDFIIRMEDYGLPQARHRVILLGIREDIDINTGVFTRLQAVENKPTVKQVTSDLPKLRSRLSKGTDSTDAWRESIANIGSKVTSELKQDNQVPKNVYDDFISQLDKIKSSPSSTGSDKGLKRKKSLDQNLSSELQNWYKDEGLGQCVLNHEARGHIVGDLHRYLYYSSFAGKMKVSPNAKNLPKALWPAHKNFGSGKFADRFRVQLANKQGTTVTCHISKDGHYFIHYDPNQCRSLTVREAARIQTFPDNYCFVGNRTQQYVQVGNAVPPYLAKNIAQIVLSIVLQFSTSP